MERFKDLVGIILRGFFGVGEEVNGVERLLADAYFEFGVLLSADNYPSACIIHSTPY
jgi:hypothetical protein